MGNSFSSDPRFYSGKQLLQGRHCVTRDELDYDGEFDAGWFIEGSITPSKESQSIADGKFKFNQLWQGSGTTDFKSLFDAVVPFEVQYLVSKSFEGDNVHVVGQYEINNIPTSTKDTYIYDSKLTGHCTIYYDREHTRKFIDGEFNEGLLESGTIYSNDDGNCVIAQGQFEYDDRCEHLDKDHEDRNVFVKHGTILDEINLNVVDNEYLYLKIDPLILDSANYENDYNGFAEYYTDPELKQLIMKCELVNGIVKGDIIVFQGRSDGRVMIEGNVENNRLTNGLMFYRGFYTMGEFDEDGYPHGLAELYHDYECRKKFADTCFAHGEYDGKFDQFDSSGAIVKTLVYSNGEFVNEITEDTPKRFTVVLEDHDEKASYLRYQSNDTTFVNESELTAALSKLEELKAERQKSLENSFMLWLENKLANHEWLTTLNQTNETFFKDFVGFEIENVLKLASTRFKKSEREYSEVYNGQSNKHKFANAFYEILNQPDDYKINPEFASTLLADIYNEYLQFSSLAEHCKWIDTNEYNNITKRYFDYIKEFSNTANPFTSYDTHTKVQTRSNSPMKVWLAKQLTDNYESIRKIVGADLLNVIKSRCGKMAKDNNDFAGELIKQLRNPISADIKHARDKKMRTTLEHLQTAYDAR